MTVKEGVSRVPRVNWRDRFDVLKIQHDNALVELHDVKRKYNSLLDKYRKLYEVTVTLRKLEEKKND